MGEIINLWADESGGIVQMLGELLASGQMVALDCASPLAAIHAAYWAHESGYLNPKCVTLDDLVIMDREHLMLEVSEYHHSLERWTDGSA